MQKNTGNAEELKAQIAQLQKDIEEKNARIEQMALDAVVDEVLNSYKVRNKTAVKALLKDLVLDENGEVKGLTKQLDSLKESDGYLFDTGENNNIKGAVIGESSNDGVPLDLNSMSYSQLSEYLAKQCCC